MNGLNVPDAKNMQENSKAINSPNTCREPVACFIEGYFSINLSRLAVISGSNGKEKRVPQTMAAYRSLVRYSW